MRSAIWIQVLAFLLLVASLAQAQKDPTVSDSARKHFRAGVAYIDDPSGAKYEEALQEFRIAYAESPAAKIMNNVGFCALNLERDGEAIEAYEIYLAGNSADLTAKVRQQVEKDVAMLKASLVKVTLTAEPKEISIVDERRNSKGALVVNRYKLVGGGVSLGLHPGHHKLTASAQGYKSVDWEFDADAASVHQHEFKLIADKSEQAATTAKAGEQVSAPSLTEPPKAPARGVHTGVYVGGIAAGVFAVAATVTGVMTISKHKDFDTAEKNGNDKLADKLSKSGGRLALMTDIGVGAAIVSAGVATYFYFASPSRPAEKAPPPVALQFAPTVGVDRAGLALSGSF